MPDLRRLVNQGRLSGQTCPPNRRTDTTNIRTLVGQIRNQGQPCNPTITQHRANQAREKARAKAEAKEKARAKAEAIKSNNIGNVLKREREQEMEEELRKMLDIDVSDEEKKEEFEEKKEEFEEKKEEVLTLEEREKERIIQQIFNLIENKWDKIGEDDDKIINAMPDPHNLTMIDLADVKKYLDSSLPRTLDIPDLRQTLDILEDLIEDKNRLVNKRREAERIANIPVDKSPVGNYPRGVEVLNWREINIGLRNNVIRELRFNDRASDVICSRHVSQSFILRILIDDDMEGYVLKYKRNVFGFIFWEERNDGEKHVQLLCVKKPPNKFRGFRFGKKLIQEILNELSTRKITLEAVKGAVDFYKSIGFELDEPFGFTNSLVDMTLIK
jgi:hypothetical protein